MAIGGWLALGICLPAFAVPSVGGQYGAAREAMQPPGPPPPLTPNALRRPDFLADTPRLRSKAAVRQLAAQAPAAPVSPQPPGPPPEPSAKPETPGAPAGSPEPPADKDRIILHGDRYDYRDERSRVEGHVELKYQDLTLRSGVAELDENREWGTFTEDVEFTGKAWKGSGERLRINLETEQFEIQRGKVTVEPAFLEQQLEEPLYLYADSGQGTEEEFAAEGAQGTSCDYPDHQHYFLRSRHVKVIAGRSATFERPELYLFGRRILRYPYDVTISLTRKKSNLFPEFGVNDIEGYYAKLALAYLMGEANSGFLKLHLTEKRGPGIGFDHLLDQPRQSAEASVFVEPNMGSFSGRLNHRLQMSRPLGSETNFNWQRDTGYGLGTESLSGDVNFRYDTTDANTLVGFQQSVNSTAAFMSRHFASNISHHQRLGTTGDYEARAMFTRGDFAADQVPDEELDTEVRWQRRGGLYDANVLVQKRYDLDASAFPGDDAFYGLDRTPDAALTTDAERFRPLFWLQDWDARLTLYAGRFDQHPENLAITRTGANLELPGRTYPFSRWGGLRLAGRFNQYFYDDDSARWTGEVRGDYSQRLTHTWESRVSFAYAKTNGFSPLRIDYATNLATVQAQIVRLVPDRLRLNLSLGRDFKFDYFYDIVMASELMLSRDSRVELQGGYSLELSQWRPLNLRWLYARGERWFSALTVNFDLEQTDLTNLSTEVDWSPSRLWRVQFLGNFSNFGGFNQADFKITRDLHCLAAQLTYIHATREVLLGFGIKAFSTPGRTFGISRSGGYFDSGFGGQF